MRGARARLTRAVEWNALNAGDDSKETTGLTNNDCSKEEKDSKQHECWSHQWQGPRSIDMAWPGTVFWGRAIGLSVVCVWCVPLALLPFCPFALLEA